MKKIILLFVAVLVVLGGIYFVTRGREESVEELIIDMQDKMAELDSVKAKGVLQIAGKTGEAIPGTETLAPFIGDIAVKKEGITAEGVVTVNFNGALEKLKTTNKEGEISLNVVFNTGKGEGNIGLATRMLGSAGNFVQLSALNLPKSKDTAVIDLIGKQLLGEWIKIEPKNPVDAVENKEKIEADKQKQEQYKEAFKQARLFDVSEKKSGEKLDGVTEKLIKLAIRPNKEDIRKFVLAVYKVDHEDSEMPADEQNKLDTWLFSVSDLSGAIWIGENSKRLYRATVEGPFAYKEDSEGIFSLTLDLYDHDRPAEIAAPEIVITQEELTSRIIGAMFGGIAAPALPIP